MDVISPKRTNKNKEVPFDKAQLLVAELARLIARDIELLAVIVFFYAGPLVSGLRLSKRERLNVDAIDQFGDWYLSEVTLNGRRRLFMHAYSVALPSPAVRLEIELWKKLKDAFREEIFRLTSQTLVMRTRELGFHVISGGRVYAYDSRAKSFKVFPQFAAVFRQYGMFFRNNELVFFDLRNNVLFDAAGALRSAAHMVLEEPPHYDINSRRLLRFALMEGRQYFAFYDSTGPGGMKIPIFFDDMKYADEFQMIISFLDIAHGRFTRTQRIVNGRHYPVHMQNVTFGLYHDYDYTCIYSLHTGQAVRILHSNLGHIVVCGGCIVELNHKVVLRQIAVFA